jgi:hypothetical protein
MQANAHERTNTQVQHHLLGRLAWHSRSTDIDLMCVVAIIAVGLLAMLYSMLFGLLSQEICTGLANLSKGLLEVPNWDDMFL